MFTQEQILEIKQRLRETSAKDTEFPLASLPLEGDEIITVVQGGENKKFPIDLFFESFSQYIDGSERVDFFNVSRYVQITKGYPEVARLTLPEAVENCPEDVRRPGQVITFMDNNDNWVTWQCNGEKKEQWLDTNYWKPLVKPEQEDVLLFDRIITEELPHIGATTNQTPNAIVYASFYKRFLAVVGTGDLATYYYAWPDYGKYTDTVHDNKPYDNKVYLSGGRTYVWDGTDLVAGGDEQIQSDWNQNDSSKKDFIKNKPTIPAEQVQSDWNQSNSQAKDFIKNKPTIPAPITIDPQPTKDSPNAVSSGSAYDALEEKQEKLVSGLNIKTINGQSIVGEGNLVTESDTVPFDGFILLSPITIIDGSAVDPDAILYYRDANRFVAKKGDKYYNNWANRLLYNDGNAPYTSKLYPYDGAVYTWDGTTFAATGGTSVRYDAQTLTAQQKEQAAQNIGLDVVVKGDVQQSLSDAQKVQAQNNIFAKAYSSDASAHSGLGKVYLQKNNGSLTQAMINTANTVYVIQYDYTMSGNITVPAGCTLEFDGGSIGGNKTITFNNTSVLGSKGCFKNNVTLAGTVRETFNASWIVWDNSYTSANMNIFGCLFAITNTTGEIVWDIPSLYILFNGQPISINKGKEYNFNGLHLYIKNVTSASHLFACSTTPIVTDYTKISDILASSICADKMVMLIVEDQTPLYQRYGYQYAYYRSDTLMAYNGNLINYPILDYDNDPDTDAKISYVTDLAPITLRNLTIERSNDSTYILEILRAVNLAQVTYDNVKIISYNDVTLANEYMFYMEHCYDIKLTNISINTTYSVGGYGYAFSLFFCSRVLIENVDIASPWHNTGCRGVNGLVIKDSSMNFDCHVYGKDFSFENCYINRQFNSVDFVTGIISFNNCQFRNCVPLQISEDHVADLPLEVVFDNCSFENCDYLFFIYQFHAVQNLRELASMHILPTITVRNSFVKHDNATYIAAAGVNYPDTYGVYTGKQINLITENVTVLAGSLKGMNIPQWDIVKYWYINNIRCSDNNSQFIIPDDIDSLSCTNSTMTIKTDSTASRLNPMFSIAHSVVRPFNTAGSYNTEYSLSCCSVQCYKVADRNLYAIGAAFTKFDRCKFEVTGGVAYLLSFFSNYIYDLNCCYFEDPVMIGASYADTTAKERLINALNKAHLVVGYRYYNATSGTDAIFVKNVWNLLPNEYTALQNSNLKYTGILFVNGTGYKYIVNSSEVTQEAYMQVVMGVTPSN